MTRDNFGRFVTSEPGTVLADYPARHIAGKKKHLHRIIAEHALGKPLPPKTIVHHHSGDSHIVKVPDQLVICQNQAYHMLLHARQRVFQRGGNPNKDRICSSCKLLKPLTEFYIGHSLYECKACKRNPPWKERK